MHFVVTLFYVLSLLLRLRLPPYSSTFISLSGATPLVWSSYMLFLSLSSSLTLSLSPFVVSRFFSSFHLHLLIFPTLPSGSSSTYVLAYVQFYPSHSVLICPLFWIAFEEVIFKSYQLLKIDRILILLTMIC